MVEPTHFWRNDVGKICRCTERRQGCVDAFLVLAAAVVAMRALVRAA